ASSKKLAWCVIVVSATSLGEGGHGTQGPLVLGDGLDDVRPVHPFGWLSKGIQEYKFNGPFPHSSATLSTKYGSSYDLGSLVCKRDAKNEQLAYCTAVVSNTLMLPCGTTTTGVNVDLVAINAGWDSGNFAIDFAKQDRVVFACKDPDPRNVRNGFAGAIR